MTPMMTVNSLTKNDELTNLIIVTPADCEAKLLTAGFRPYGRQNHYTITLFRTYNTQEHAMAVAQNLPPQCIWATEPTARPI
jgi:hypothetical protein